MSAKKAFRADINALRAFSVTAVVLYHAQVPWFTGGFAGVDIFFVISGFLMTKIIHDGVASDSFSIASFYWARCIRIIPALLAMVLTFIIFGLLFIEPEELRKLAKHGLGSAFFTSNIQYWFEAGYFDNASKSKWLLHTWSLSVEWQFYLLYPLLLPPALRALSSYRSRIILFAGGVIFSLVLAIIATQVIHAGKAASFAFYMLPTRAWEMLLGGFIVIYKSDRHTPLSSNHWLKSIAWAALLACILLFKEGTPWPSLFTTIPVGLAALLIWLSKDSIIERSAPVKFIGKTSYSIYLWHWPILVAGTYFKWDISPSTYLFIVLSLGWISFKYIEQPTLRRYPLTRIISERAWITPAFSIIAIIGILYATLSSDGWVARIKGDQSVYVDSVLASNDRAYPADQCGGIRWGKSRACQATHDAPTIAFVGDSFIEMWWTRANTLAAKRGVSTIFFTSGGCPPITGIIRQGYGTPCDEVQRVRMNEILSNPNIHTIVIGAMWASYFQKDRSEIVIKVNSTLTPIGKEPGFQAAIKSLQMDIDSMVSAGKNVVILTTAPYPKTDVPAEIRKAIFSGNSYNNDFNFSTTISSAAPIDDAIMKMHRENINTLNLSDFFCKNLNCQKSKNGKPLYSDGSHYRSSYLESLPDTPIDEAIR